MAKRNSSDQFDDLPPAKKKRNSVLKNNEELVDDSIISFSDVSPKKEKGKVISFEGYIISQGSSEFGPIYLVYNKLLKEGRFIIVRQSDNVTQLYKINSLMKAKNLIKEDHLSEMIANTTVMYV